jgi:ATP-dependent helicase/nuclease subunit A
MTTPTAQALFRSIDAEDPSSPQSAAADPRLSAWVGASAGTGKTKVLIDRVLRLMLPRPGVDASSATPPEKVLCLTFTKTAAAEMSNRIYKELAKWAVSDDAALGAELARLNGETPTPDMMREARRLFARVLDTPGGLKIMTIHSFCQSVLKRFPVEAGLPPHFDLMDEQSAVEYLTRCLHDIIAQARLRPDAPVARAFSLLAQHLDSAAMSDLMAKIMAKRSTLAAVFASHGDAEGSAEATVVEVYRVLGADPDDSEGRVTADAGALHAQDEKNLRQALQVLLEGTVTDQKRGMAMRDFIAEPARRAELLGTYRTAFFTQGGTVAKTLATKGSVEKYPDIINVMTREAERLQALHDRLVAIRLSAINAALLTVASDMTGKYARYKRMTDRLDFDDLIIRTCDLLSDEAMVSWVLYKLDEGIDHILVDEAQDTSPQQWRVVRALASEFFSGHGTRGDTVRTLFVVGDEKQSIFSFQGADPSEFDRMQKHFGEKILFLQQQWVIPLKHSFRSTRTVLEAVDSVFSDLAVRQGVVADAATEVRHIPVRRGHAGLVEVWPLFSARKKEERLAWKMPVDVETGDSAGVRLSQKIATTIRGWLDNGDMLASRGRPVRAGDILILVQSRSALVEQIMRALKEQSVPVAGIDRMTLTEEIAVMDLLALASFALQPRDDLTLATLLKSPLIGMGEDELFQLCHGRDGALWTVVQAARPDIAAYLWPCLDKVGKVTPYEFFADILNMPCVADEASGRRAFYARLGRDIHDALDEFLNSCLHYEQTHTPAIQKFVDWFVRGEAEIKREQESHRLDQVRIMTVHASKGLQAPIVFLPDTVKKLHDHNKGRARLLWPSDNGGNDLTVPLWSPRSDYDTDYYAERQQQAVARQEEEYRRLLYVALTRAEDRLYVAGYYNTRKPKEDSWYSIMERSMAGAERVPFMRGEDGEDLPALRVSHPQETPPKLDPQKAQATDVRLPLPAWALSPPPVEPALPKPLAPSKPGADEPAVKGPMAESDSWKYHRGIIVHHILEILPQVSAERRAETLLAYLARPALGMPEDERAAFADEIMRVLTHPEFAPIFGAGSRAEVPVVGVASGTTKVISGQIDRLLVTPDSVLVIDYKTNRPPPANPEDVAAVYLKQMSAYRAVLRNIYPDKPVKCALLWTDATRLMPLPDNLLDRHAP